MKTLVNGLLILVLFLSLLSGVLFYRFRAQLIELIVSNDVAQKAPNDYPKEKIYTEFSHTLELAENGALSKDAFITKLFEISHRLEKVRYLTAQEVDAILDEVRQLAPRKTTAILRVEFLTLCGI